MIFIPSEVLKKAEENNNGEGGSFDEEGNMLVDDDDNLGFGRPATASDRQVTFEEPELDDLLITGSADMTARAWEFNSTKCLRVGVVKK